MNLVLDTTQVYIGSQDRLSWLSVLRWVEMGGLVLDEPVVVEVAGVVCDEAELVAGSLNGDEDAYVELVKKYEGMVGRMMWRFTQDRGEWDILVQDVFVQGWLSLRKYKGDGAFGGWLNTIGVRCGYRYWRGQKRGARQVQLEDWGSVVGADDNGRAEEAHKRVYELLSLLNDKDRLVLTLQYFEGLGADVIARRMGWNRAMVHMRVSRAKKKLRKIVAGVKGLEGFDETV